MLEKVVSWVSNRCGSLRIIIFSWVWHALLINLCFASGGQRLFTFHAINLITGLAGVGFQDSNFVNSYANSLCGGVCVFFFL